MQRSRDRVTSRGVPDFRSLFDALPGPALVLLPDDPKYTIVAANQAWARQKLSPSEDKVGRGLFELQPEDAAAAEVRDSLARVRASRLAHTTEVRKSDLDQRYWRTINSPVLDSEGQVQFLLHRREDVTDLYLRPDAPGTNDEHDPAGIEARYGAAFARAPIGMVLLQPDGRIFEVNQAYIDTLGYTREELLSRDSSFYTHPDDVQLTREFFAGLKKGPHNRGSIEKRYLRKDGKILWARATATVRRDDQGQAAEVIAIVEDITERKRAEEQLWASQEQIRAIYDGTYEYIGLLSTDGIVLDCNRASLEFAGNRREDVIGKPFWETPWFAATPGAPDQLRQGIAQAAAGQFVRYEVGLQRPSGGEITFDFSIYPVRNERGEVIFLVPEGRDITDQNRAAQLIEDDRRRWRELLRQTPAGIALLGGPEHRFEWVNPAYEKIAGRPAETIVGKSVREAIPEIESQAYVDLLNAVYTTAKPFTGHELPVRLETQNGTPRDLYLNFVYLPIRNRDGKIDGIFVHVIDVTDAVLARKKIEESERQFRTLVETIPHLAWMADESGNRFWYNHRWYAYTGMTFDEVKDWGWQKVHDPSVLPNVIERWHEALTTGEPFELMYPLKGADGSFRSFLTRVEPVKNLEGRVVRWFGTNTDITEQRRTEQELRRMNRELEEFAYVASHDLQEPIRMVNIYTQLILRNLDNEKERLFEYSAFVETGVKKMEALIQDLLTFSRNVHHEEQPVGTADLQSALGEALSVLKGRIEDAGATIHAVQLPETRGETQQLSHVFQNILSNALKYRRQGVPLEIDISAERVLTHWTVCIRDNGIGFEPQYAERIFGLFKRLHKDEYPGTGLGLAICKRIVERYGGSMWAESVPGSGASFYFSLPAVTEPDA